MEEGGLDRLETPFLLAKRDRNSVSTLKCDFFSKLPDKVRSGIDSEHPFHIDFSGTADLAKGEKEYYEKQFSTLRSFEEVDSTESSHVIEDERVHGEQVQQERATNISNGANVLLLAFKIYATVKSGSIAIAASTLDSLLDLMAWWCSLVHTFVYETFKYPIGKLRIQPVGIIVFAAIMATLGFRVLIEALKQLIEDKPSKKMTSDQLFWLYMIMLIATVVKHLFWFSCRSSGNKIVHAYAEDHYFDVITSLVGSVAAVLGDKYCWWIDPADAIMLAVYTISNWSKTILENGGSSTWLFLLMLDKTVWVVCLSLLFTTLYVFSHVVISLVGQSASPEVLQKLTYLVLRYHPQIKRIDTVPAYTFGVLYFVEVDIELPEDLPLREAHEIGESLQIKIEELPEVERAFVHLDAECEHKPSTMFSADFPTGSHNI